MPFYMEFYAVQPEDLASVFAVYCTNLYVGLYLGWCRNRCICVYSDNARIVTGLNVAYCLSIYAEHVGQKPFSITSSLTISPHRLHCTSSCSYPQ